PEQSEPEPEPVVELEADGAVAIEEAASETAPEMNIEPDIEPVPGTKIEPAPEMAEPAPEMAEPAPEMAEPAPEVDISVELAALEEQTEAVLTGVLDRLGAAHHRPFSRA